MSVRGALVEQAKNARAYVDYFAGRAARNALSLAMPTDPRKVFVSTFQRTLACNPRYIVDELLRRHPDVRIVVSYQGEPLASYPESDRLHWVRRGTPEHFREQATARVWLDNGNDCSWFPMQKKPDQLYLQTWHGSLGLKRIDAQYQTRRWLRNMAYAAERTDFLLSNSLFEDLVYRTTFWPETTILRTGHARNDLLFDDARMQVAASRARKLLGVGQEAQMALYAPTFRERSGFRVDGFDFGAICDSLHARFGGEWVVAIRSHYRGDLDTHGLASGNARVIDATGYPDIQELMAAARVGITDYSSWICDYVLTGRPGFLLVSDLAQYAASDRGFYYPLEATPFAVCTSVDDLCQGILSFDDASYQARRAAYLDALGCTEDGHATERAADLIDLVLGGDGPIDLSRTSLVRDLTSTI